MVNKGVMMIIEECEYEVLRRSNGRCEGVKLDKSRCIEVRGTKAVTYKGIVILCPKKINRDSDVETINYKAFCYSCLKDFELSKLRRKSGPRARKKDSNQMELF